MFEKLKKINKKLAKTGLSNSNDFLFSFLDYEDEILSLLKNFSGTKSEIYLSEINKELTDLLKFSSLFSDITLLNTAPSPTNSSYFMYNDGRSKYFRERKINIPPQYVNETGIDAKSFLPIYFNRNDQELKKLFSNYKPLVKSERLIIRPLRGVCVNFPEVKKVNLYYVDPNTPNNEWYINEVRHSELINIDNGAINYTSVLNLFDITLPYLANTGLDTLCKILNDEEEILSTFRTQLKNLVVEAGNDYKRIQEIKKDILRPSIDTIERKFKTIQNRQRLVVRTTLGTFVLSLAVGTIDSSIVLKAIEAMAVMGLSNADFNIKVQDLKDNPHYLLWRIKVNN